MAAPSGWRRRQLPVSSPHARHFCSALWGETPAHGPWRTSLPVMSGERSLTRMLFGGGVLFGREGRRTGMPKAANTLTLYTFGDNIKSLSFRIIFIHIHPYGIFLIARHKVLIVINIGVYFLFFNHCTHCHKLIFNIYPILVGKRLPPPTWPVTANTEDGMWAFGIPVACVTTRRARGRTPARRPGTCRPAPGAGAVA